VYGFLGGIWHGIIAPFGLIMMLFKDIPIGNRFNRYFAIKKVHIYVEKHKIQCLIDLG
jgi:hypothetical protein